MNKILTKTTSVILTIALLVSLFAGLTISSQAATYSYNTGKRGVVCTSLSSAAKAYYTGSYTYANLKTQSASTLKTNLKNLMTKTQSKVTSYAELRTLSAYSDATAGSSTKMTTLYSSDSISNVWDNGTSWNREHVWPQSLGTFTTSNAGSDLHHLRPADSKVNNTRGNLPYGVVRNTSGYKTCTSKAGTVAGYYNSSYYEPMDNVKGDIARILLYVYVRWGETPLTKVIQSQQVLLDWIKSDPVDTWEMGRNDVVQSIQGNRNVFIDYPELAYVLLGKSIPSGMTTPSGGTGSSSGSSSSSGSTSSSSTGTYKLVTSTSQLKAGATVIIASYSSNYAMSKTQNTNNRASTTLTKGSGTCTPSSSVATFTLGNGSVSGTYSFKDKAKGTYLYAASSSSNYLKLQSSVNANASWKITVTSAGKATIVAQGSNTRKYMQFNSSSKIFSCYGSASQTALALYVLQ